MLDLIKLWLHAVFVSPAVRVAFWSIVGAVFTVEFPTIPDGVLPPWLKGALLIASGVMIPHAREFALQKALKQSEGVAQKQPEVKPGG